MKPQYKTKEYHRQKAREHYQKYKEEYNKRNQLQKLVSRSIINEAKVNGCGHCSEQSPDVLEFHHIDEKEKDLNIAQMLGMNHDRLKAEIAKCVVLCATCHRREHSTGYVTGSIRNGSHHFNLIAAPTLEKLERWKEYVVVYYETYFPNLKIKFIKPTQHIANNYVALEVKIC